MRDLENNRGLAPMSEKTTLTAKPKAFCVATEGATCDGRKIERAWIEEMAATYSQKVYGARVNLEHLRGVLPGPPFGAYGDVTALEARKVDGDKLALFATIDPTSDLVVLTKARQKVYTSIEIDPNFANTGKAYLVGLAITDSPASLGCEMLNFAAGAAINPLAGRKTSPGTYFSEGQETLMSFDVEEPSLMGMAMELFFKKRNHDKDVSTDVNAAQTLLAENFARTVESLTAKTDALDRALIDLTEKLSREPEQPPPAFSRPAALGGPAGTQTDF